MFSRALRDPWGYGYDHPLRIFDQHFGGGLLDEHLLPDISRPSPQAYLLAHHRPRRLHSQRESGTSQVECTKDKFLVKLDVQHFAPEEVSVKTIDGPNGQKFVVIEGKHEEKQDEHGYISRQFSRRYLLPNWVKDDQVICSLSSDGVLGIAAEKPKETPGLEAKEKVIPITQTGQPSIANSGGCAAGKCNGQGDQGQGAGEKMATE